MVFALAGPCAPFAFSARSDRPKQIQTSNSEKHLMKQLLRISVFTLAVSTSGFLLAQNAASGGYGQSGSASDSSQTGNSAGQASASKGASAADDQTLHRQVHDQLSTNPDLQNVQIAVENGKVVLTGTVPNKNDKKEAKRIASSVPGVKKVKENITVTNPSGTSSAAATSMGKPSDNQSTEQGNTPNNAGSISGNAGTAEPGNPGSGSPNNPNSPQRPSGPQQTGNVPPRLQNNFFPQSSSSSGDSNSQGTNSNPNQQTPQQPDSSQNAPNSSSPDNTQAPGNTSPGSVGSNADPEMTKHPDQNSTEEQNAPMSEQPDTAPPHSTPGTAPDQTPTPPPQTAPQPTNPPQLMTVAYQTSSSSEPQSGTTSSSGGAPSSVGSQAGSAESTTGNMNSAPSSTATGTSGTGTSAVGTSASGTTAAGAAPAPAGAPSVINSDQVKSDIQSAYKNDPDLNNANINVAVTEQAVQLSGSVPNSRDKDMARRIAESFSGNRSVVDSLTVAGGGASSNASGSMSGNAGASAGSTTGTTAPATAAPQSTSPSGATTNPPQM
jgi:osmotically-inducible protein OsmY